MQLFDINKVCTILCIEDIFIFDCTVTKELTKMNHFTIF